MGKMIDALESRVLLSSSLLAGGVLKVVGTNRADQISINYVKIPFLKLNEIVVNEITLGSGTALMKKYNPSAVKKIQVFGGGGDDLVMPMASSGANLNQPFFFDGGAGNDTLTAPGYKGKITALGGTGDDVIATGSGHDSINGGAGNDRLTGNAGNDTLIGGSGMDLLQAEAGNDYYVADDGAKDTINGGDGIDKAKIDYLLNPKRPNEASIGGVEKLV